LKETQVNKAEDQQLIAGKARLTIELLTKMCDTLQIREQRPKQLSSGSRGSEKVQDTPAFDRK
jgi:hypothetical protein